MADDSDYSFGGIIQITIDGVRYAQTEADITLDVANIEVTAVANQDGTPCYTSKPGLYGAQVKFRDNSGIDYNDLLRRRKVDATIKEVDNTRTHLFTGARIIGKPSKNVTTGEVDGLEIRGPVYRKLNS
ncbi:MULTISPECIES: phage tail tube protein [unclassified Bradyrhizobium]|uniref:phage tail tube protein n=1 Tax=unclassified Bradyrhizobium TaxID=2631580 RepID=UPI0029167C31|nr:MULTISPECIES: phage tail tube protein [unclassified Bradyrhizobium]